MSIPFVIALLVFAAGILLFLLARLMRSYPLVFFGLVALIGASVAAFLDPAGDKMILGAMWLAMGVAAAVAGALYWYKNLKGAFWFSFSALVAMVCAVEAYALDQSELMQILIPALVFVGIGLLGCLIVPRLFHRKKEERKHITNVYNLIGRRLTVEKEAEGELPQRGVIGDIDWSIRPAYTYEHFKVGDVVKVVSVKGVTLLCVRDAKDERKELKEKRKAEQEAAKAKAEAKKAEKEAKKAEEEAKKAEEPKEEPKKEEPKVIEQPKEEPKKEEPKVEEPKAEEPAPAPAPVEEPVKKPKAEFIPFGVRLAQADPFVRDAYNELKAEVLSYGIKSRISSTGDTFRLHTKTYVKMVVAGKYLKLYLALNPEDYKDTTYPFEDASRMGAHTDAPFVFKIKSGLSVRRAKVLIGDAAKKDELTQGEVVAHNYASEVPNE